MKTKFKKTAALVFTLAVLLMLALASAASADQSGGELIGYTELISYDSSTIRMQDGSAATPLAKNPALADGRHIEWIDRVDFSGAEYALELYAWMRENSDGDGAEDALIDPTQAQFFSEKYVYELEVSTTIPTYPCDEVQENLSAVASYVHAVYDAFDRDNPEVFWLAGTRRLFSGVTEQNGVYTQRFYLLIQSDEYDIRATDTYESAEEIYALIKARDEAAEAIVSGMPETDAEGKIKYFNDWLTKNNCYNGDIPTATHNTWECVSALLGMTGKDAPVCEAYARALKVLCDKVGIPCVLESGLSFSSSQEYNKYIYTGNGGTAHMWNAVEVDGSWYNVDVTWNDPVASGVSDKVSGYENEKYLLVGSETKIDRLSFNKSHLTQNIASTTNFSFSNSPFIAKTAYVKGAKCNHSFSRVDLTCSSCGKTAKLEVTNGYKSNYYIDIEEALLDAMLASSTGAGNVTLKLLENVGSETSTMVIYLAEKFTLDLNGKTLFAQIVIAHEDADVIVTDSGEGGVIVYSTDFSVGVFEGNLVLRATVEGVYFEGGNLELSEGAFIGGVGIAIPAGISETIKVGGAPAGKILVTKVGSGAFATALDGVELCADWFEARESGKIIVVSEDGGELSVKLALPTLALSFSEAVFNGGAHKPTVNLGALAEGRDYTVSFSRDGVETADFVNSGEITVTVKGIGEYGGVETATLTIKKAELGRDDFEIQIGESVYNGKPTFPTILVSVGAGDITDVIYKQNGESVNPVNAGKYSVYLTLAEGKNYLSATEIYIGDFEIAVREITVAAKDQSVVQNALLNTEMFEVSGAGAAAGHSVAITFAAADTSAPGERELAIATVTVRDENGNDVSANYSVAYVPGKMTVRAHEHDWSFSASGSVITAVCTGEGPCPAGNTESISINAPNNTVYNAFEHIATVEGSIDGVLLSDIVYKRGGETIALAPTEVGKYSATVTAGGVSVTVEFEICYLEVSEEAEQSGSELRAPAGYKISGELCGAETAWGDALAIPEGAEKVTYYLKNAQGEISGAKTAEISSGGASIVIMVVAVAICAVIAPVTAIMAVKKRNRA